MNDQIEIYVRPGSDHNMLNIYVPMAMRDQLLKSLSTGSFELPTSCINFEISVQAQWITDPEQRVQAEHSGEGPHVRVPLKAINIHFGEG
jgi:hypothetical protein